MNSKIPNACPRPCGEATAAPVGLRELMAGRPSQAKTALARTQNVRDGIFCQYRPPERIHAASLSTLVLVGTAPASCFELGIQ